MSDQSLRDLAAPDWNVRLIGHELDPDEGVRIRYVEQPILPQWIPSFRYPEMGLFLTRRNRYGEYIGTGERLYCTLLAERTTEEGERWTVRFDGIKGEGEFRVKKAAQ